MKKILVIALISISIILVGCTKTSKTNTVEEKKTIETPVSDSHTSQNSLDYIGIYDGTIPCNEKDCDKVHIILELENENNYKKTSHYYKNDKLVHEKEEKGAYSWINNGSAIKLEGDKDASKSQYKVQENQLIQLDENGSMYNTENINQYILTKK